MSAVLQITSEPRWFKSSYSGGNTTECVECAYVAESALIRDSKNQRGPIISVGSEAWLRFVSGVSSSQACARAGS